MSLYLKYFYLSAFLICGINAQNIPILTSDFSNGLDGWDPAQRISITNQNAFTPFNDYIQITPGLYSGNQGKKLIIHNTSDAWTGNYNSKGVTGIQFNFANWSDIDAASIRISVGNRTNVMQDGGTFWVSDSFQYFPESSGWGSVYIPISESTMHRVASHNGQMGIDTFEATLDTVESIRIFSSVLGYAAIGDEFEGVVGFDSIALVGIPEPSIYGLLLGLLLAIMTLGPKLRGLFLNRHI